MVAQFDVYWVPLDPTQGSEMKKTRPCVVISPDEINAYLRTVIVAPMTHADRENYHYRVATIFRRKDSLIALDQIRTVDKSRLQKKIGTLSKAASTEVCENLVTMFTY